MAPADFSILLNAEHDHKTLAALARQVEARGFSTLWYADERFYRETYTGLAVCAMVTERISLGTGVTDPYTRHPALTAMAVGSLDELSEGRAVIGIGAGRAGYHNLGIELVRPVRRIREAIEIVRRLLAGERLDYAGEVFTVSDLQLNFATRADIPVILAADGPQVLRLAGAVADGVMIGLCSSPKILAEKLAHVRLGQEAAGRTALPRVVARLDATVSHDHESAMQRAKLRVGRYLWIRYPEINYLAQHSLHLPAELERRLQAAGPAKRTHDMTVFEQFVDAIPDELVYPIHLVGSPRQVADQMRAVIDAGADEIMVYPISATGETPASTVDLVAEAVRECNALTR